MTTVLPSPRHDLPLHRDESGQLLGVPCHDGALEGILFLDRSTVSLRVRSSEGERHDVVLEGVMHFRADTIMEGNIIDRMYLWPLGEAPSVVREHAAAAFHMRAPGDLDAQGGAGAFLFRLECSYGADITALVRNVRARSQHA